MFDPVRHTGKENLKFIAEFFLHQTRLVAFFRDLVEQLWFTCVGNSPVKGDFCYQRRILHGNTTAYRDY